MAPKLRCPGCARQLAGPDQPGTMVCDGCGLHLDPAAIRYQPAPPWRKVLGWVLLTLGGLSLLGALRVAMTELDAHNTDFVMTLVGLFLLPALALFGGMALVKGKDVVVGSTPKLDASPQEAGPGSPDLG
jgi:hypothetical protein